MITTHTPTRTDKQQPTSVHDDEQHPRSDPRQVR